MWPRGVATVMGWLIVKGCEDAEEVLIEIAGVLVSIDRKSGYLLRSELKHDVTRRYGHSAPAL